MKESLGTIIKEARKKHNLSQNALANIINTTQQSIANWEKDKNKPDILVLKSLCEELDINFEQLKREFYDRKIVLDKSKIIIKRVLIIFLIILCIVMPIIASVLIINRNKINVYYASIDSDVISMSDSIFIETGDEYILKLGTITPPVEAEYNINVYYKSSQDSKVSIYRNKYQDNIYIIERKSDSIHFNKDFDISNNLFITISYGDKNYTYELKFHKLYAYEKIFNSSLGAYY